MNNNRNLRELTLTQNEIHEAEAEYKREFPALCRALAITPAQLNGLNTSVVIALFGLRMWRILDAVLKEHNTDICRHEASINDLETRLRRLEEVQSPPPPPSKTESSPLRGESKDE